MDLTSLQKLDREGRWEAATQLFEQMLREKVYAKHQIGGDVSHLVHYTTLDALISMLGVNAVDGEAYVLAVGEGDDAEEAKERVRRRGYLRVYDTFSANDPNEGTFFVKSADPDASFQKRYASVWRLFEDRSKSPAYQTSLRLVSKPEEADELIFWRTYGRDGTGCALVFPAERLEGLDKLYTVRYGIREARACLDCIETALDAFVSLRIPGTPNFAGSVELRPSMANVLSPLVYLYKSDDYDYEREARVVVPFPDLEKGPLLQKGAMNKRGGWRHFAQLPELKIEKLLGTGSEIVFGPSVNVSPNLKFVLRNLLQQRGFGDSVIRQSRISYRA